MKSKEEMQQFRRHDREPLSDDKNPIFLFSTTHTDLLVQIARRDIRPRKLAIKELEKRGLNREGKWVGFDMSR